MVNGLYTDEERKLPLQSQYFERNIWFESCIDLSIGIKVHNYGRYESSYGKEVDLMKSLASFIAQWTLLYYPKLNGFNGFDTLKYEFIKD